MVKVAIAADHAGLPLRPTIADAVRAAGHEPLLYGPDTAPPEGIDHPLVAQAVAGALEATDAERGTLVRGSGAGLTIAANRIGTAGVDVDALAATLQTEGADAFVKSWDDLLACIGSKSDQLGTAN